MRRTTLFRQAIFAASAVWTILLAAPASACSDLPNICAMNAQHHQNMVDISSGMYSYGDYYGEEEYYGDDYYDSGYYSGDIDYSAYAEDPGRSLSNEAASFVSAVSAEQAALEERLQDPGFRKAYERYSKGAAGTISRTTPRLRRASIVPPSTGGAKAWCACPGRAATMPEHSSPSGARMSRHLQR